jgi:hypothetical protein
VDHNHSKSLVFRMQGSAVSTPAVIPPIDGSGTTKADGFELDLFDPATDEQIGTVLETLADIRPANGGLAIVGTQVFRLADGELTVRGLTSVAPTTHGSPEYTHITGAIPRAGENNVLSGTGAYEGAIGTVRLSGAVNLADFESQGRVAFNCLFVVRLSLAH